MANVNVVKLHSPYPRHFTKVHSPEIEFRWNNVRGALQYSLEINQVKIRRGSTPPVIDGVLTILRKTTKQTSHKLKLPAGFYYFYKVTAHMPSGKRILTINAISTDPHIPPDYWIFYVKPPKKNLEKYFEMKADGIKSPIRPFAPLLFYLMERYVLIHKDPSINIKPTSKFDLDKVFASALDARDPGFRDIPRLERLLGNYKSVSPDLRKTLFGAKFMNLDPKLPLPSSIFDSLFRSNNNLVGELAASPGKTLSFALKLLNSSTGGEFSASNVPVKDGDHDFSIDPSVWNSTSNPAGTLFTSSRYRLKITVRTGSESISINLIPVDINGRWFLRGNLHDLLGINSASYYGQLFERIENPHGPVPDNPVSSKDSLSIQGGVPVVISVNPPAAMQDSSTPITLRVCDAGSRPYMAFENPLDNVCYRLPRDQNLSLNQTDQTFLYQEFTFCLHDYTHVENGNNVFIAANAYYLRVNTREYVGNSINVIKGFNTLLFNVNPMTLYQVSINSFKCIDESDPEWFGDDSISFQVLANTSHFLQKPIISSIYDGFSDGETLSGISMANTDGIAKDSLIYAHYQPSEIVTSTVSSSQIVIPAGFRQIEDYLTLSVSIFEHDDLDWLAWLLNEIIDLVQNFLTGLISTVTGGVGGYVVDLALEVSGLNDLREQAINSLVTSWEVDLLHHRTHCYVLDPNVVFSVSGIDFADQESAYSMTFTVYPFSYNL